MTVEPAELHELSEKLDGILEGIQERGEPEVAAAVAELVEGLQRVHAEGLRRLAQLLAEEPELFERALDEPVVSNLFFLYDLAVVDPEERVREALSSARVMAASHGGELEVLGVEDGRVRLRVEWTHDSVSREAGTLRKGVEWALRERLPGFREVEIEGLEDAGPTAAPAATGTGSPAGSGGAAGAAPDGAGRSLPVLGQRSVVDDGKVRDLQRRMEEAKEKAESTGLEVRDGPRTLEVAEVAELPGTGLHGALVEDEPVLLVRRGGEIRGFRNTCPGSMLPLHFGSLEEGRIHCPWHGCRFDGVTGERVDGEGPDLERFPVTVASGRVRVEVP